MTRSSGADVVRGESPSSWMASRARNAIRRWLLVLAAGSVTFVVALVALVLVPRQATRTARVLMPPDSERPDTEPLVAAVVRAAASMAAADSALTDAREAAARAAAEPAVVELPPELAARRDSLAASVASLNRLLTRAENAPLPESYRALGESREMRSIPRVRALLDSLADIERERETYGGVGGVDPIFVALTARAGTVGRSIQDIAQERRAALRRELAQLRPTPPPAALAVAPAIPGAPGDSTRPDSVTPPPAYVAPAPLAAGPVPDTAARIERAESARRALAQAEAALAEGSRRSREYEQRVERARELANVAAPPVALLAAALVLGAVTGFLVSLFVEIRYPKVADAREAERLAGARVIATIRPQPPNPDRQRRRADRETSPLIEIGNQGYRLLYLHVSATGSTLPLVTVTGDDANIVATVAANLAAASAYEARTTLLVDGDLGAGSVSGVLRVAPEPGLATVIAGRADWAEVVHVAVVGRDRTLDVIPSGIWTAGRAAVAEATAEQVRHDLTRLACRYDMTVLVADESHAERGASSFLPGPDVILVARVGFTPIAWITKAIQGLGHAGTRVRGVVLWDHDPPHVPTREEISAMVGTRTTRRRTPVGSEGEGVRV